VSLTGGTITSASATAVIQVSVSINMLWAGDGFFFCNHMTNSDCHLSGQLVRVLWVTTPQVH
jgi:hypothetical protein